MGLILEFGSDPHNPDKVIDYGSVVEKGTVLAKIDPTPYEAAVEQAEAAYLGSLADLLQLEGETPSDGTRSQKGRSFANNQRYSGNKPAYKGYCR